MSEAKLLSKRAHLVPGMSGGFADTVHVIDTKSRQVQDLGIFL